MKAKAKSVIMANKTLGCNKGLCGCIFYSARYGGVFGVKQVTSISDAELDLGWALSGYRQYLVLGAWMCTPNSCGAICCACEFHL